MGLSAPKQRNKLSHDPNNTTWSKSSNTYGQKILCAQGWKPGDYLGASNANHADHYTSANASHIRILLREDNLGLGAKIGKGNAETFGLSLFSGVLGRLNGKSEAVVEKEQSAMRDAELRNYHAVRFGGMRFVSGGLLVGDTVVPVEKSGGSVKSKEIEGDLENRTSKKNKKRKIDGDGGKAERSKQNERASVESPLKGVVLDTQRPNAAASLEDSSGYQPVSDQHSEEKSTKKNRKQSRKERTTHETVSATPVTSDPPHPKGEKRARKEERRRRKEEKRLRKAITEPTPVTPSEASESNSNSVEPPKLAATATSAFAGNPRTVRRRYIDQKRMASLDPKAMREIFMLTGTA